MITRLTYDASSEEQDGSEAVDHRHDEMDRGDGDPDRDQADDQAHEAGDDGESARDSRKDCRRRYWAELLPLPGVDGEGEDGAGEEGLERSDDEDDEHLSGVGCRPGHFCVVVCRRDVVD